MEYGHVIDKDTVISVPENELQLAELSAFEREMVSVSFSDNSKPTTIATESSQIVGIDFLEEAINDAESNKKTLVSALESVNNMAKEVELHEERAKQATEEASKAGQDVLSKAEDLKQMLKHAKDANDIQAGEVYGERAIVATEARELQSWLLKLSKESDKSLLIIEEIRRTLEARLAAAGEEQEAAEQQKLEREELAHKLLSEQNRIMDSIGQESERLKHEAEENNKLREFLMDRGRVVDGLQGEIYVICENVMLLKERVDGRLPLRISPSSTTSSLASSSTSLYCTTTSSEIPEMIINELPRSQKLVNITDSDEEEVIIDELPQNQELVNITVRDEEEAIIDELPQSRQMVNNTVSDDEEAIIDEFPQSRLMVNITDSDNEEVIIDELPQSQQMVNITDSDEEEMIDELPKRQQLVNIIDSDDEEVIIDELCRSQQQVNITDSDEEDVIIDELPESQQLVNITDSDEPIHFTHKHKVAPTIDDWVFVGELTELQD